MKIKLARGGGERNSADNWVEVHVASVGVRLLVFTARLRRVQAQLKSPREIEVIKLC